MHGKSKVTASENKKALQNQIHEWFMFDEMVKNGRTAMLRGITPIHTSTMTLMVGPINNTNLQVMKGKYTMLQKLSKCELKALLC